MQTYRSTFRDSRCIVGISGIIAAGKTTLARGLSEKLGWDHIAEPVEENPYLSDFYADMKKWAFPMQIFLLHRRFAQHQAMVWATESSTGAVQDRTIYEDVIFAKMLHESGAICDRDFKTYQMAFGNMCNFLHRPDLIIYLDVSPETAHKRLVTRSRGCEVGVSVEYLTQLRAGYEDWVNDGLAARIPVLRLDWNNPCPIKDVIAKMEEQVRRNIVL